MIQIDINTDCGEGSTEDEQLLRFVTSANIACGYHAGDPALMRRILRWAKQHGVGIGAHPSYPDRPNFGRTPIAMTPEEIEKIVTDQMTALDDIAVSEGTHLMHVKLHGALYHASNADYRIAEAVCGAVGRHGRFPILIVAPGSFLERAARLEGLLMAREAFVDRTYLPTGTLTPRSEADSVIADPERAVEQALDIALRHQVKAVDGSLVEIHADTLCIHSDTPGAGRLAEELRTRLSSAHVRLTPLTRLIK